MSGFSIFDIKNFRDIEKNISSLTIKEILKKIDYNVEKLDLSGQELSEDDFKYLAIKLKNNEIIKNLNISNNRGDQTGIYCIGYILPKTKIEIIDYSNNEYTKDEDIGRYIGIFSGWLLNDETQVKELYLKNNNIISMGFNELFERLRIYRTLELLDLSGNKNINKPINISIFYNCLIRRTSEQPLHIKFCDCNLELNSKVKYDTIGGELYLYEIIERLRQKNIIIWLNYYEKDLEKIKNEIKNLKNLRN